MKRADVAVVRMICKLRRVYTFLRKSDQQRRHSITIAEHSLDVEHYTFLNQQLVVGIYYAYYLLNIYWIIRYCLDQYK